MSGTRSRRTTARTGRRIPASRRAVMSQITVSRPKATIQYAPDHFTAVVRPSSTPAPNRHQRAPSAIPARWVAIDPSATAAASLALTWSRSATTQAKAARTNTAWKMSSNADRDWTWLTPSQISRTPAIPPSSVDLVIRRTTRTISSTLTMPATAEANRQPNGV